jgi:uncharacterized membrane protein
MKTDRVEAEVEDAGCLRWVYGIPLVLLNVATAFMDYEALTIQPQGVWDDGALTAIELACVLGLIGSVLALALTIPTVVKRVMSRWSLAPPTVMLLIAGGRLVYVLQQYPVDSSTP